MKVEKALPKITPKLTPKIAPKPVKVAVIGGGSWGTTMAHLCAHNTETSLLMRDSAFAMIVSANRNNPKYLRDHQLHEALEVTGDPAKALKKANIVVIAVPSYGFRHTLRQHAAHIPKRAAVISLAKGLESGTSKRMSEVIAEELPNKSIGVLTGPNLAKEIMSGHATAAVLAMKSTAASEKVRTAMAQNNFRIYTSKDIVGTEIAGATKNVIALGTGLADGLGAGHNTKAALVTRGLAEMSRLGVALGGKQATFSGLAGMGDLVATCFSTQSRNRTVGERLGRGESLTEVMSSMREVAEGVKSTSVVVSLARSLGVDMPIAEQVNAVLSESITAAEGYQALLDRPTTTETRP